MPDVAQCVSTAACVCALKIRTVAVEEAVGESIQAATWLLERHARQLFYKYCSTFDSTAAGNIGPVTDALLELVNDDLTVLLPAYPENGRTVTGGLLLVNGTPLADTAMRFHPLTPMTESSLLKMMDAQTRPGDTGLVAARIVAAGAAAVRAALKELRSSGKRYVVIDSESDADLRVISDACADLKLLTGGAGVAAAIPATLRNEGLLQPSAANVTLPDIEGHAAVLAGSCSEATQAQVARFANHARSILINPLALHAGDTSVKELISQAVEATAHGDVVIASTTSPKILREVQRKLGIAESAELVERTLAEIAVSLRHAGIRKFAVAGGETSGAIASALSIKELKVGPQIDPGVPWMVTTNEIPTCITFKSGNFGSPDFFNRALGMLP